MFHSDEILQLLIEASASINDRAAESTALHLAASYGRTAAIKFLTSAEHCTVLNVLGGKFARTPLHEAAYGWHASSIEVLIKLGANTEAQRGNWWTPLHDAAWGGQSSAIKTLVGLRASVAAQNYEGKTPLHIAAIYQFVDAIKALVDLGAPLDARDKDLMTPLDCAELENTSRKHGAVAFLEQLGAPRSGPEYVELSDGNIAFSPVYKAMQYSSVFRHESVGVGHGRGRLDSLQAWSALQSIPGEWLQVATLPQINSHNVLFSLHIANTNFQIDVAERGSISGVVVQGRRDMSQWVISFKVRVSADLQEWDLVENGRVFKGNED